MKTRKLKLLNLEHIPMDAFYRNPVDSLRIIAGQNVRAEKAKPRQFLNAESSVVVTVVN